MKKIFLLISQALAVLAAFAQQDPQFTQNMFMKLPVNPGYAGTRGALCATTAYRTQWVGFAGAPKTFYMSVDIPVYDLNGGLGMVVMKDKLGNFNFTHARGSYAYHRPMNKGIGLLSIGLELGFMQASVDNIWLAPDGSHGESDPEIPDDIVRDMTYDVGAGIYYRTDKYYVGASISHAPGSAQKLMANQFNYQAAQHGYIMAGYILRPSSWLAIRPSLFAKMDGAVAALDLHCDLLFEDRIWAGLSYRPGDAIAPKVGIALRPNGTKSASLLKIGYAYDLGISDLKGHHNNTHEIVVNYCIRWAKPGSTHQNPRLMGDEREQPDPPISEMNWIE